MRRGDLLYGSRWTVIGILDGTHSLVNGANAISSSELDGHSGPIMDEFRRDLQKVTVSTRGLSNYSPTTDDRSHLMGNRHTACAAARLSFRILEVEVETTMSNASKASAVERALLVLETLDSSRRGLNISELSHRLHIPKSSTHVIVLTLERLGYLQKQPESLHYRLGLKAYALGQSMTKSLSISELALPHMRALVDQVRLSAHLAVHDGDQGVYIQKVEAPGLIRIDTYVGRRMDLHCTAVGKIILAFGPPELLARLLAKEVYIRYTKRTIMTPKALQREMARVRKAAFALDDEEEELAVRCVAVPVFRGGRFAAGLSVAGTTTQIPMSEVEAIAARLSRAAAGFFPEDADRT